MGFSYSPKVVTDGLVLYLDAANPLSYASGSTKWNDLSRGRNNGTLINGPSFQDNAIVFDGANDIVSMPYIQDTGGSFAVEVWAKNDSMTGAEDPAQNRDTIFSFNTGTQGYQLLDLEIWNDGMTSFNGNGTNYSTTIIGNFYPVDANNWHCYTLSVSNGIQNWYKDGEFLLQATPAYTATSAYFKLATRGLGLSSTGQQWTGKISSAKIYNRALSAQEVQRNYQALKSRFSL